MVRTLALVAVAALLGVALFIVFAAASDDDATAEQRGTESAEMLRGTPGDDTIFGLGGPDRLYGLEGNDYVAGGAGPDLVVGGPGRDVLAGGPGDDRIEAKDGEPDVIHCGSGNDTIERDEQDRLESDCPTEVEATIPGEAVVLVDTPWACRERVDLDLVKVTLRTEVDDAVSIDQNCSGRIGRIEVDTWTGDGIKVQNRGTVAHDLVIESGYVKCHAVYGDYHQDGIQVMGGTRLTFRNLAVDCLGNANLFLSEGGGLSSTPTDVVCESCIFGPQSAQTLFYAGSIRSGARDTVICTGRFRAVRVEPEAQDLVDEGNRVLDHDDPTCADVTASERDR
jgi:hypothetical protein